MFAQKAVPYFILFLQLKVPIHKTELLEFLNEGGSMYVGMTTLSAVCRDDSPKKTYSTLVLQCYLVLWSIVHIVH